MGVGGARAKRTKNMRSMVVTLDVSKLSGWLNAYAYCQAERRLYDVCGMRAGRSERVGQWRCKARADEGPKMSRGGGAKAESYRKHVRHVGDAGRVPA